MAIAGVGAAAVVGGVVLWATAPSGESKAGVQVGVVPMGVVIGGRF